jgi:DNA polymerase III subunit gamma/tau
MSYIALYRKWRPVVFEDMVEQEHVVKTLRNSIITGRIAHAYLFCGTRGTGKTTAAKIFSRAINCLHPRAGDPCNECEICREILSGSILDVVEIDAASNNSVDNVREIRDEVIYAPSKAKYKVYIIDEVHMLSMGAFNALLKTLEEPPAHVVFILATTEPHKLPATILSRCQRFDFRRITIDSIVERLDTIAVSSGVNLQKDAARLIAKMSDGALRDAVSILDQCVSLGSKEISYGDVLSVIGMVNDTFIGEVVDCISKKDIQGLLNLVEKLVMDGKDIAKFSSDLVFYYRDLLICKTSGQAESIIETSKETLEKMNSQCKSLDREEIYYIIKELSLLESGLKWATHPRILLEVTLIKLCEDITSSANDNIVERVNALEKRINNASFAVIDSAKGNIAQISTKEASAINKKDAAKRAEIEEKTPHTDANRGPVLNFWEEILTNFKKNGRMVLYTNLLGTKLVEIDSKCVGIVFSNSNGFNKMIVSKLENIEVIETKISEKLGREVKVKCLDAGEEGLEAHKQDKDDGKNDFINKTNELSKRLGVSFNVIDE